MNPAGGSQGRSLELLQGVELSRQLAPFRLRALMPREKGSGSMSESVPRLTRRSAAVGLLVGGLSLTEASAVTAVTADGWTQSNGDLAREMISCDGRIRGDCRLVVRALRVVFSEHRIDMIDRFFAEDFVQHSSVCGARWQG